MAKAKKKVIWHRVRKGYTVTAECGAVSDNGRPTWRGVTCKRCLKVKEAQDKAKKKKG